MTEPGRTPEHWADLAPRFLRMLGVRSWLIIGIAGVTALVAVFFKWTAGLMIPLVISLILGALFYPAVNRMERARIPRAIGSVIVMLFLAGAATLTLWTVVTGIVSQSAEIEVLVQSAVTNLGDALVKLNVPQEQLDALYEQIKDALPSVAQGVTSAIASGLSSTAAFFFGVFLGAFMLFYLLTDWARISGWIGGHIGVPDELGSGIVDDSAESLQLYFGGVTITGFIVAIVIGIGAWVLGVPLIASIMLVTFLTAYIPYFGAIVSGAFAFMLALGSGGLTTALIMLAVVLVAQNVIQTIVQNKIVSDKLSLHPLAGLVATILGGTMLGLIGGILGSPIVAIAIKTIDRTRAYARKEGLYDESQVLDWQ